MRSNWKYKGFPEGWMPLPLLDGRVIPVPAPGWELPPLEEPEETSDES